MALNAVAPINTSQMTPVLQEYIDKKVQKTYETTADLLKMFQQEVSDTETNIRGRKIPIELTPNASLGAGSPNGGILATPGGHGNNALTVTYQWLNSGLEMTYEAILNNATNPVSNQQRRGIDSTIETLTYAANCYASNGNGTNALATITTAYVGGTPTVVACAGTNDGIGATQLKVGQRVLFFDSTGATQRVGTVGSGAVTIATLTATGFTGATNIPSDVVIGDIVVPEGTSASATAIKGMPFLCATTTGNYFGLSKTTYSQLRPTTTAVGGALTAAVMLAQDGKMYLRGDNDPDYIIAVSAAQQYAYTNLVGLTATPQFFVHQGNSRPLYDVGGSDINQVSFWGKKIQKFKRLRADQMYFFNPKHIKTAMLKKIGSMIDIPSGDWVQALNSTADMLAAKQRWYDTAFDNYSADPRNLGALTGLTFSGAPTLSGL